MLRHLTVQHYAAVIQYVIYGLKTVPRYVKIEINAQPDLDTTPPQPTYYIVW